MIHNTNLSVLTRALMLAMFRATMSIGGAATRSGTLSKDMTKSRPPSSGQVANCS